MPSRNAARTVLEADAWYETDNGAYAVDCPECGAPATVPSIIQHGRCTASLNQVQDVSEIDESELDCTAELWFLLGYSSDADETGPAGDIEEPGVPAGGEPAGTDGPVDEE